MLRNPAVAAVLALVLGVLAFALWYQDRHPRIFVGTGTVRIQLQRAGGGIATHKTRDVSINGVIFQQFSM